MAIRKQLHANNARTTLSAPVLAGDTTVLVTDGSRFPNPGVGEYFLITLDSGSLVEIVEVTTRATNTFTVIRARENTISSGFPSGTTAENRVTAATYANFAKLDNRMSELSSVDLLEAPINSNGTSYVTSSIDDGGNPIVALKNTGYSWKFPSYLKVVFAGSVSAGTTTTITSTLPTNNVGPVAAGKYLIQFTSGNNAGSVRLITAYAASVFTWATALGFAPASGDQFEVSQSTTSIIIDLEAGASNAIIYSILLGE